MFAKKPEARMARVSWSTPQGASPRDGSRTGFAAVHRACVLVLPVGFLVPENVVSEGGLGFGRFSGTLRGSNVPAGEE
jgi:hypothetical protein